MVKFMFKDDGTLADGFVELIPGVVPVQDTGVAPAAPTGLTASNAIKGYVRLNWTASETATSYKVYRHTGTDSSVAVQVGTSTTGTVFNDTTAVLGTTYNYWVKATNSYGDSAFSSPASGSFSEAAQYVTVTGSSTYTVLAPGIMNIYAWAGGGGGGIGYKVGYGPVGGQFGTDYVYRACGGGGGAGSYADKLAFAVVTGDVITITAGAGGSPGSQGSDTIVKHTTVGGGTITEIIHCGGGRPGGNYSGTVGGVGGAGGSSTAGDNQQSGNQGASGSQTEAGAGGTSKEVVGMNDGGVHGSGGAGGMFGNGSYGNPGLVKYSIPA